MELTFTTIKMVVIALAVVSPLVILLIQRWRQGNVLVPHSNIIFTAALLPIAYLFSTIFAVDKDIALLGYNFNADSLVVVVFGFLAMIGVSLASMRKVSAVRIVSLLKYLSWAVIVLFIVQLLSQIGFLSWLSYASLIQPINSWLDVAAFGGLLVIFLLQYKLGENKVLNIKLIVLMSFLMLLLVVFTNVATILVVLALIALMSVLRTIRSSGEAYDKKALILPLIVLVVSVSFTADNLLLNSKVSGIFQNLVGVSLIDVRPNWQGTLDVAKGTFSSSEVTAKLFGPGVGSFSEQWRLHKPIGVNMTQFWSTNFNNAIGFVPTSIITGGVIVFTAWVLFLLMVLWGYVSNKKTTLANAMFFIWIFAILNPINTLTLIVAFVITGLAIAELARARNLQAIKYNLSGDDAHKIMSIVIVPIIILSSVAALLVVAHRGVVNIYIQQASNYMIEGNMNDTELTLNKIKKFADVALVEQGYTKIAFAELVELLQKEEGTVTPESLQAALANLLAHARRAIELEPQNPINYTTLGSISEQLMQIKIEGAGESALAAYESAALLDPYNPAIPLAMARVYGALEQPEKMVEYIERSLRLKGNYVQALYQYGLVKLSQKDAKTAIQAFGTVAQINSNHANALYYLSLALVQEERFEEALAVMQRVASLNPDNEDVAKLVVALQQQLTDRSETGQEESQPEAQ